jgi:hypothetical protein
MIGLTLHREAVHAEGYFVVQQLIGKRESHDRALTFCRELSKELDKELGKELGNHQRRFELCFYLSAAGGLRTPKLQSADLCFATYA